MVIGVTVLGINTSNLIEPISFNFSIPNRVSYLGNGITSLLNAISSSQKNLTDTKIIIVCVSWNFAAAGMCCGEGCEGRGTSGVGGGVGFYK